MYLLIEELPPADAVPAAGAQSDILELDWHETGKSIIRAQSIHGRDIALRLLHENQHLHHDMPIFARDDLFIRIAVRPCPVIVLSPQTLPDTARACYEIGNKHAPLFIDGNELLLPDDEPMFQWLQSAGFSPRREMRRLSNALRSNSAHSHHHEH